MRCSCALSSLKGQCKLGRDWRFKRACLRAERARHAAHAPPAAWEWMGLSWESTACWAGLVGRPAEGGWVLRCWAGSACGLCLHPSRQGSRRRYGLLHNGHGSTGACFAAGAHSLGCRRQQLGGC